MLRPIDAARVEEELHGMQRLNEALGVPDLDDCFRQIREGGWIERNPDIYHLYVVEGSLRGSVGLIPIAPAACRSFVAGERFPVFDLRQEAILTRAEAARATVRRTSTASGDPPARGSGPRRPGADPPRDMLDYEHEHEREREPDTSHAGQPAALRDFRGPCPPKEYSPRGRKSLPARRTRERTLGGREGRRRAGKPGSVWLTGDELRPAQREEPMSVRSLWLCLLITIACPAAWPAGRAQPVLLQLTGLR